MKNGPEPGKSFTLTITLSTNPPQGGHVCQGHQGYRRRTPRAKTTTAAVPRICQTGAGSAAAIERRRRPLGSGLPALQPVPDPSHGHRRLQHGARAALLDTSHSPASLVSCPVDSIGSHTGAAAVPSTLLGTASTPSSDSPLSSTRSLTLDVNALSGGNAALQNQHTDSLLTPPRVTKSPSSLLLGNGNGGGGSSSSSPSSSSLDFLPNPTNYGGFLPTHTYYGSNGTSTGTSTTTTQPHTTTGVYLSPPVMPPSLLYPQLYGSMSHPSFQFLGNDLKCVMDAAGFGTTTTTMQQSQQQRLDNALVHADTTSIRTHQQQQQSLIQQQQQQPQHATDDIVVPQTPSLAGSVLDSLRTQGDHHSVWRPY
ncbi:hypothetical protein MTO96_024965 [Rhipicephalus appendiculatus]